MSTATHPYSLSVNGSYSDVRILPSVNDAQWADIEAMGNDVLTGLESTKRPNCLVDLTALHYMGSSMIAFIVRIWKVTKERGGRCVVVATDDTVTETISLAGLDRVWTVADSREEGLRKLGVREGGGGDHFLAGYAGVAGVVIALVGLGLWLTGDGSTGVPQGMLFGGALLTLLSGLFTFVDDERQRRMIGVGLIVASVGVGAVGFLLRSGQIDLRHDAQPVAVPAEEGTMQLDPATGKVILPTELIESLQPNDPAPVVESAATPQEPTGTPPATTDPEAFPAGGVSQDNPSSSGASPPPLGTSR